MKRYGYLIAGLVTVAAVAVVALFVWPGLLGSQRASAGGSVSGSDQAGVTAVVRLLKGLPAHAAAGDTADLAPSLHVTPAVLRKLVPPGSVVTPAPATWRRTGAVASITVILRRPGQHPARYVAVMFRERRGWKLAQTFPGVPAGIGAPGASGGG